MKRSQINEIIKDTIELIDDFNFKLPPFAYWGSEDWETKGAEYNEIRDNMLGWDITDYGSGNFDKIGLLLFTIRNGNLDNKEYIKPYAEKLLIVKEGQVTPYHFHWNKMEDIINRGGGNLMIKVYNSKKDETFDNTPVKVSIDGRNFEVEAGTVLRLTPGESITLPTGQYHKFWGEENKGTVLVGEVSQVNDDTSDNRFYETVGRFPKIDEDEEPLYYLCNEYPKFY